MVSKLRNHSILFRKLLLAVAAPLLLLGVTELALRLVGFGKDTALFIEDHAHGGYRTNPDYTSLFFPPSFGLKLENFYITKEKPEDAFRVFVLGESAAMGVPEPGFGLTPQLRAQLKAKFPQKKIEVFNVSMTAINSHCVRLIAHETLRFHPDLLVVYMGNNEVVGPYGPGSAISDNVMSLGLIRASLWLRSTRIGQALQSLSALIMSRRSGSPEWRGMEMFSERTVTRADPRLKSIYANFERNLDDIVIAAEKRQVPVAVCTVAVNLRECAPFASRHLRELPTPQKQEFDTLLNRAKAHDITGSFTNARDDLQKALGIDPDFAEAHFLLARDLEKLGDPAGAKTHYLAACDDDALRFRADSAINAAVRRVARNHHNATLVDVAHELGSDPSSVGGLSDCRLFFEHVHLTWEGNYAIAALISRASFPASQPLLSSEQVANLVGFTPFGRLTQYLLMNQLTSRPPFTGQTTYAEDRSRILSYIHTLDTSLADSTTAKACVATLESVVRIDPNNSFPRFHLAALYLRLHDIERARELNKSIESLQPESPEHSVQKAYIEFMRGHASDAEMILSETIKSSPYYFQSYGLLAQVWSSTGRSAYGAEWFSQMIRRQPTSRVAHELRGQLLKGAGDQSGAEKEYRAALTSTPDSEGSLIPLVELLASQNRNDEVLALLLRAHEYNPKNSTVAAILEQIYEQQGDTSKQVEYMKAMAASGPVRPELFLDLGELERRLNRPEEARISYYKALARAKEEHDQVVEAGAEVALAAMPEAK